MIDLKYIDDEINEIIEDHESLSRSALDDLYKLIGIKMYLESRGFDRTNYEKVDLCDWVDSMHNEDGSHGPHWTMDQTNDVMRAKHYTFDPEEFYATMNMMFSDYGPVAKEFNINNSDFFAKMSHAFLADSDAVPHKIERYAQFISRKV